jgi:hypothetical protein
LEERAVLLDETDEVHCSIRLAYYFELLQKCNFFVALASQRRKSELKKFTAESAEKR